MTKRQRFLGWVLLAGLLASCTSSSSGHYFGTYSAAEQLYSKGKYEAAAKKYHQYLNEKPQGNMAAIAEYYMAKCYKKIGKTEEARTHFQQVMRDYPKTSWADFSKKQIEDLASSSE